MCYKIIWEKNGLLHCTKTWHTCSYTLLMLSGPNLIVSPLNEKFFIINFFFSFFNFMHEVEKLQIGKWKAALKYLDEVVSSSTSFDFSPSLILILIIIIRLFLLLLLPLLLLLKKQSSFFHIAIQWLFLQRVKKRKVKLGFTATFQESFKLKCAI